MMKYRPPTSVGNDSGSRFEVVTTLLPTLPKDNAQHALFKMQATLFDSLKGSEEHVTLFNNSVDDLEAAVEAWANRRVEEIKHMETQPVIRRFAVG